MPAKALFLGLDLGTSGARAVVIGADRQVKATAKSAMADHGSNPRDPAVWWAAAQTALQGALAQVDAGAVRAMAVDGTSGTMVGLDATGAVIGDGLMYNDACTEADILKTISDHAPATSAAHGPTSGAARAVLLARRGAVRVAHQADWIAGRLSGDWVSDANNALKTGYDPVAGAWPAWLAQAGVDITALPPVVEPGTVTGKVTVFGLTDCLMIAGTTDGCASFLATGASDPGDGVTALGTTLTVKLLSDRPIFAPEYGIYSHRLLGQWLAGGASNSGGAALLHHFTPDQMAALSASIDPETDTGFDYYPLPAPGERFPIADPSMPPRVTPRPQDDATFLHALFEGVANVEALAFRRLAELGAPALRSVRSVGGGAANPVWTRLRARRLTVPMPAPLSDEAAFGTALLALRGAA
ncbi:MAG: carbohydrate kinase [Rhodobacteraceae bacterium PARR1]|nr:MAG: carbohydrate kinase [Rhodobacteraceae bacterium PARR1]